MPNPTLLNRNDKILEINSLSKSYPSINSSDSIVPYITNLIVGRALAGLSGLSRLSYSFVLSDINITIMKGERVGLIGTNGSGKSTLLKLISKVVRPTAGCIWVNGSLVSLLEVGTGFNEELSGYKNIFFNASLYGMGKKAVLERLDQIVDFSGLDNHIDKPIKYYSSGMKMRLAFSIAAHLNSELLLLDEVLAVGDLSFQQKCLARVDEIATSGRTIMLVSHSMDSIMKYTDRCIWLDKGTIIDDGPSKDVVKSYLKRYTKIKSSYSYAPKSEPAEKPTAQLLSAKQPIASPNQSVSVISIKALGPDDVETAVFTVDSNIRIIMRYKAYLTGYCIPGISLKDKSGDIVFTAYPSLFNPSAFETVEGRSYEFEATIPGNLLNTSLYSLDFYLFDPRVTPFERFVSLPACICFQVVENTHAIETSRGFLHTDFPGPTRPLLKWVKAVF